MVMPVIVRAARNLFAPSEDKAMEKISRNNISIFSRSISPQRSRRTRSYNDFLGRAENFPVNAMRKYAYVKINEQSDLHTAQLQVAGSCAS